MSRISKDPEIRKNELVDAAEALFVAEGYENTSVSAIVKRIGVAQGTFYYYFKSKEDVLEAVIARVFDAAIAETASVINDTTLDAAKKLVRLIQIIFTLKDNREDFFRYIHEDRNALLHQKLAGKLLDLLSPILTSIIQQGLHEKSFSVEYPSETAELMLVIIGYLYDHPHEESEVSEKMICAVTGMLEKTLGIAAGKLKLNI
ncbi:MAG: TetR/AcrR family transcriptional regulator [Spirochaetae bacterium HGW-Spirochaetae-1]|jgi:AcrR family transcriptional regulator|nr:MAG: TetR/AcrR family transcriptional regulator [Spirochaetae bacterium HGW-Spirochaetae-1]